MMNSKKLSTICDCFYAIKEQLEMIKFSGDSEILDDGCDLITQTMDKMHKISIDLLNGDKPTQEDTRTTEEKNQEALEKFEADQEENINLAAKNLSDTIDKDILDDVMKDTTSTESVGGLTGAENMGPVTDENVAATIAEAGEELEDTKNPVDLEQPVK